MRSILPYLAKTCFPLSLTFEPNLNYDKGTKPALMKKLFRLLILGFSLSTVLLLSFTGTIFAATAKINPYYSAQIKDYVGAALDTDVNAVTNNDTSVTIRIEGLHPYWCYLFGKGTSWTEKDHILNILHNPMSDDRPTDDAFLHFYVGNKNEGGWSNNYYATQAGGTLCGFKGNPDGSGSDSPANYIRADQDGVVWLYDMCENFEGIRSDCNAKFVLGKTYNFTIFHVTCFIQTVGANLDQGDHYPDPNCSLDRARIKNGTPTLRIWGADTSDGFPSNYLNFNFKDTTSNETASAFKMVPCVNNCSFVVYSAKSKSSGQFDINSNTVRTAFGAIPRDPVQLATVVLRIALGLGGGLAFLLMVYGSFRLIFSAGNPEGVQQGREILTAAIIGLLVIIFSTFILQLIGISILGLTT